MKIILLVSLNQDNLRYAASIIWHKLIKISLFKKCKGTMSATKISQIDIIREFILG